MNSLFAKLALALLVIIGLMGSALFLLDRYNTRTYYDELSQTLNMPIAMYVTGQRQLIDNGVPDIDSLHELAAHAMIINPTAEIYLLDTDGRILGHGLHPGSELRERVALGPIETVLEGDAAMPVRGTDPRAGASPKVFSVAPVMSGGALEGYLYVVLGGQTFETLVDNIGASYTGRTSTLAIIGIVAFTGFVGLLVFSLLTRRLKNLRHEIRRVAESGFEDEPQIQWRTDGDEIDDLGLAFRDMSKRIAEQLEQLKETDQLRRELISNISHDLRTPLSAIQGYIETLIIRSESMSAEDRDRFLRIARKHTIRLNTLISDLFELSKLDSESMQPILDRFSLAELVQDISQEFRIEMERKRLSLSIDVDAEHPHTIGDIGLIQRVLENLVRNAVRFTPAGGEITIAISERPRSLAVTVADTGPGIPEADLPRIFDRFYRARDGEEARSDSSGLGLAIVKRILDLHDSRISVTSRPNAGTRFEFELPRLDIAA